MLILIRCNDIINDTRAKKYLNYLKEKDKDFLCIGWDRENTQESLRCFRYFKKKVGYNIGGFKAAYNRTLWILYVFKELIKLREDDVVLHGCDVDSAFPAALYKLFINSKAKLIFDVFDWFSDSMYKQNRIILAFFKLMEVFTIKRADEIIICEPERMKQLPSCTQKQKVSILPNIPVFDNSDFLYTVPEYKFNNSQITFAYVGGLTNERCLEEIIDIAVSGKINLLIAGYGNKDLERMLAEHSKHKNIKYFGKVPYELGLRIMYNADVIYAMYATTNRNHVYAAPNKYYEALYLSRPIFTTCGTIVEEKVLKYNTGFVSGETIEAIKSAIDSINPEKTSIMSNNAKQLWETKYASYTHDYLHNIYENMITTTNKKI